MAKKEKKSVIYTFIYIMSGAKDTEWQADFFSI